MKKINGKGTPQNLISTVVSPLKCRKMFMRSISFYTNKKVSTQISVIIQGKVPRGPEEGSQHSCNHQTLSHGNTPTLRASSLSCPYPTWKKKP